MQITAIHPKSGRSLAVDVDLGNNLEEMKSKLGEEVVYNLALKKATIFYQDLIRNRLSKGMTDDEIKAVIMSAQPGLSVSRERLSPIEKAKKELEKMSPEQRLAFLKEVKEAMAKKA